MLHLLAIWVYAQSELLIAPTFISNLIGALGYVLQDGGISFLGGKKMSRERNGNFSSFLFGEMSWKPWHSWYLYFVFCSCWKLCLARIFLASWTVCPAMRRARAQCSNFPHPACIQASTITASWHPTPSWHRPSPMPACGTWCRQRWRLTLWSRFFK